MGTAVLSVPAIAQGVWTVKYIDAVIGAAPVAAASDVVGKDWVWSGKTFVHSNASAAAPGVYALTLP